MIVHNAGSPKVKLFSFYDGSFEKLKDRFVETIKDDYEVNINYNKTFSNKTWCGGIEVWLYKTQYVIDCIKNNMGDVIVVADIDMQFFKSSSHLVLKCMESFDLAFQRNPRPWNVAQPICIGFMGIRCSHNTSNFFEKVLQEIKSTGCHDQQIIVELLGANKRSQPQCEFAIKWNYFPKSFWAYSSDEKWNLTRPINIVLHHATGAKDEATKLIQMDEMAEKMKHPVRSKIADTILIFTRVLKRKLKKLLLRGC
ncbi:MAG: putative nucleotide-diphospho-sugar transferase [Candidatus Omnitrophota bacterium]|jgi:hypothetical protein